MASNSYVQTVFDKAFIDACEYLIKHRKEHQKFRTMKDFMLELGLSDKMYVSIRNAVKGVPKHIIPEITHTLTVKYGVSPTWLTFRKGTMMAVPIAKEAAFELSYVDAINEVKILKAEVVSLRTQLKEAHSMIKDQQQLIRTLAKPDGKPMAKSKN